MRAVMNTLNHRSNVDGQRWLVAGVLMTFCILLLAGCSGGTQPFAKADNRPVIDLGPPPENYAVAGPGAENDIDYETLYGPGTVGPHDMTLQEKPVDRTANAPPVKLVADNIADGESPTVVSRGEASKHRKSIKAVAVLRVRGALGKGNDELTDALRDTLSSAGWAVITRPRNDALTISGEVNLSPPDGDSQKVTLAWTVASPDGQSLGTISQSNRVPTGSLDRSWGKTATHAAHAAVTGIFDLVEKLRALR